MLYSSLCVMEFSIDSLHKMEKDLNTALNLIMKTSKVDNVDNLNRTILGTVHILRQQPEGGGGLEMLTVADGGGGGV